MINWKTVLITLAILGVVGICWWFGATLLGAIASM